VYLDGVPQCHRAASEHPNIEDEADEPPAAAKSSSRR
jgi:hypothetical protein